MYTIFSPGAEKKSVDFFEFKSNLQNTNKLINFESNFIFRPNMSIVPYSGEPCLSSVEITIRKK